MQGQPLLCPYCKSAIASSDTSCVSCKAPFPWSKEVERLEDILKEREPNRLRATSTLVQEALDSAKTGKPVSGSAIKGFLTSWLLPRTAIVLGSVLGGLVLCVQTYILWRQTELIDFQTTAARVEQEAKLRERLALLSDAHSNVARVSSIYRSALDLPKECSKCARTLALGTDFVKQQPAEVLHYLFEVRRHLLSFASPEESFLSSATGDRPGIPMKTSDVLRRASAQCLLRPQVGVELNEQAVAFEQVIDFARPYDLFNVDLKKFDKAASAVDKVVKTQRVLRGEKFGAPQYYLTDFAADFTKLHQMLGRSLDLLLGSCQVLIDEDQSALRLLKLDRRNR